MTVYLRVSVSSVAVSVTVTVSFTTVLPEEGSFATSAVPPVVCNAVIVGAMLAWESTGFSAAFAGLFAYNALTVGIGEAAVCFLLGVPLLRALEKRAIA